MFYIIQVAPIIAVTKNHHSKFQLMKCKIGKNLRIE